MYQINTPYIDKKAAEKNPSWKHNSHGFRGPEYDASKKNILIAGCSIHYCHALNDEYIFPNLLVDKLGEDYGYLNVSMPGTGIETQIKNITWALSNFKFEKFIWLTTPVDRVMYYHETEGMLPYNAISPPEHIHSWFSSIKGQAWVDVRIVNDYDAMCKTSDSIETLFVALRALNIDSYVSSWSHDYDATVLHQLRERFNVNPAPFFFGYDKASDNVHPGIKSHMAYADQIYELFEKR